MIALSDTHAATTNLNKMPQMMTQYESSINTLDKDIQALQEIVSKTWKKEDELKQLKSELAALDRKISLEIAPPLPDDNTQNQSDNTSYDKSVGTAA